jgi:hypothetical protein
MTAQTKRKCLLVVACYLVLAAGFAFTLGSLNMRKFYRLAQDGDVLVGAVTRTDCENHAVVYYSFRVGDNEYSGNATSGGRCAELGPGSPVDVSYVREDPSINTLSSRPSARFVNELISVGLASIFVPAVIVGASVAGGKLRALTGNR